jgi:hypothetical protein
MRKTSATQNVSSQPEMDATAELFDNGFENMGGGNVTPIRQVA